MWGGSIRAVKARQFFTIVAKNMWEIEAPDQIKKAAPVPNAMRLSTWKSQSNAHLLAGLGRAIAEPHPSEE